MEISNTFHFSCVTISSRSQWTLTFHIDAVGQLFVKQAKIQIHKIQANEKISFQIPLLDILF